MARVLILSYHYLPDGLSTAMIIGKLSRDLQQKGHDVRVMTSVPSYNYDPEIHAEQPLRRRWFGLYHTSTYHGIPVWHTTIGPRGERGTGRIRAYLIHNMVSFLLGLLAIGRVDVIMVVSPPLTSGPIGWLLARLKRARYFYNVQELYPETYITMGAMTRDSLPAKLLFAVEKLTYRTADALTPICDVFARDIISKGVPSERVHVIPNFVDIDFYQPGPKDNPLAREHGLVDQFVVLYAGNIGFSQSFDTLLDAAERLLDVPGITILIIGDGNRRQEVEQIVAERNLKNVMMLPYQPQSRVPEIYATGDLGLVPLMKGTAQTTLPSKIYSIMATGQPVLAAVDLDSDIVDLVQEAQCGVAVPPDDVDALEAAIRDAYADQEQFKEYGRNGRRYAVENYAQPVVTESIHQLIESLAQK